MRFEEVLPHLRAGRRIQSTSWVTSAHPNRVDGPVGVRFRDTVYYNLTPEGAPPPLVRIPEEYEAGGLGGPPQEPDPPEPYSKLAGGTGGPEIGVLNPR